MITQNPNGTIGVKGASYDLRICGHVIDVVINGIAFASLDIRTAVNRTEDDLSVTQDAEKCIPELKRMEKKPGEALFVWSGKSSLWDKEYTLSCSYNRFCFYVKVKGSGNVDSVNYFSGNMAEPGCGSGYEFSEGFYPSIPYNTVENYTFRSSCECHRPSILMAPPMFCYVFRCEGIGNRLALGLVAERGEHNFHSFDYNIAVLHNRRAGFYLTTDQDGHTRVDGEWTAPYIIGYSATDVDNALRKYSDYYYASGIAKPRKNIAIPRFWHGPLACGWIEQGEKPSNCTENLYERLIETLRKNDLHPTAIIIDDKWMTHYATFEADQSKWPDLRAFVERRRMENMKTMLWIMLWSSDGWDDALCVTGDENALKYDESMRMVDPSHPAYLENLDRAMERIFSDGDGCYNCDGIKIDYAFANPKGKSVKTCSGKYGVELMYDLMERIYRKAKEYKPDALINNSACHPYFGHICDQARLHDYFPTDRFNLEDLSMRAKMFSIAMPGVLLDTDNSGFVSRRDTMRWQLNQQIVGVPDLYAVSPNAVLDLNEDDLGAIAEMWHEYSARVDGMYGE